MSLEFMFRPAALDTFRSLTLTPSIQVIWLTIRESLWWTGAVVIVEREAPPAFATNVPYWRSALRFPFCEGCALTCSTWGVVGGLSRYVIYFAPLRLVFGGYVTGLPFSNPTALRSSSGLI